MKKLLKRAAALVLTACMLCGTGLLTASAAGPYTDGDYTAKAAFLHESKEQASMCNVLFDHDADITVSGGLATVKLYVANPVPAFPEQGADGTVTNVVMTLDGLTYPAASDITSKPMRVFDETNPSFGVEKGKAVATQVLTFTGIPAEKLDLMASGAKTDAYVNVVMMTDVIFRIRLTEITRVGGSPEPEAPAETSSKNMQITAEIVAPEATYDVVIPEAVSMGTLSSSADNSFDYQVSVTAGNLGSGKVVITAPESGSLTSGSHSLTYANSFGSQETSVSATMKGRFTVSAADVAAAAAGSYSGTASFAIAYYNGK